MTVTARRRLGDAFCQDILSVLAWLGHHTFGGPFAGEDGLTKLLLRQWLMEWLRLRLVSMGLCLKACVSGKAYAWWMESSRLRIC